MVINNIKNMSATKTLAVLGGGIVATAVIVAIAISFSGTDVDESVLPLSDTEMQADPKINVFASFYPYYEITRNVAGSQAEVRQFMPSGVEAHDWEPRAGDIRLLQDANVFVYNGLGMESYVDRMISSGEYDHITFVNTSNGVELLKPVENRITEHADDHADDDHADERDDDHADDHSDERDESDDDHADEGHGHSFEYDPHIWLDPILIKQQVVNIRDALIQTDPTNTEMYQQNAAAYLTKLDAFDAKVTSTLSGCKNYTVVTFHNAFTYFGQRYGLEMYSIGGLSPDTEASALELVQLTDFVKDNNIKIIFTEDLIDDRIAEVIAENTGAQVMTLSTLEALTLEESSKGMSFLDKMEQNLDKLEVALDCQ